MLDKAEKNCQITTSDMMKKLFSLLFIFPLVKKIHIFLKFMSVLITFVAINSEEILMNDFVKVYAFNVNT